MKRSQQGRVGGVLDGRAERSHVPLRGLNRVQGSAEGSHVPRRGRNRAYALLDVVLAVALFAITVTGLLRVLRGINDTSAGFARDRFIQQQLEGLLAEKRRVGLEAMASETLDELSGITFRTYAEPFEIDNGEGDALGDLYKLTAEATFLDDGGEQVEKAELIIHVEES